MVDAAAAAGLDPIVVVVPPAGVLDGIDLAPAPARRERDAPGGPVELGPARAPRRSSDDPVDAAVILPGDQPRVRPDVIRALVAAAEERADPPFVVARYAADAAPNPVLARRAIWRLADELAGDRGFGPVLGDASGAGPGRRRSTAPTRTSTPAPTSTGSPSRVRAAPPKPGPARRRIVRR